MTELKTDAHLLQTTVSGSTFVNADCFDVFPFIEDKSIDAIICDLPYGTTNCKWDSVLDLNKLWEQYKRILKDDGVVILFAQTPFDKVLGCSNLEWLKYEWIWEKTQATGYFNAKKMPMKAHENILVFYNKKPKFNPQKIICAVPVASPDAFKKIKEVVDQVVCLEKPLYFEAVSQYYENFDQIDDVEIISLLKEYKHKKESLNSTH